MHALTEEFQSLPPVFKSIFRPSIVLRPTRADETDLTLGQSRMGGRPDLPSDFKWPKYKGKHLVFVAQFALEELEGWSQMLGLPATGHLYFFHDQDHSSQLGPKQKGGKWVMYSPAASKTLYRADFPDDIEDDEENQCPLCKIEQHHLQQHAPPWSLTWGNVDRSLSKEELAAIDNYNTRLFDHLRGTLGWPDKETQPWHVIGGFPTKMVQDPVEWECEDYSSDGDEEELDETIDKRADWVQLLQCDYDEITGTCWSDCGMLCYMIRKQDLEVLAFDRVVAIMQSH